MITLDNIKKVQSTLNKEPKTKQKTSVEELTKLAQQKDAKRKKTLTKELKEQILYQLMLEYKKQDLIPEEKKPTSNKEWDVPIGTPIKFFDPELSYELTGYRPITAEKGLDFDPSVFTQAADYYLKNGKYTDMLPNTFKWINHWKQEFDRCQNGMTVGRYTITGLNYFFLNYYRLLSPVKKKDDKGGSKRSESFPTFIAKQYEYFHYLELCKKADYDGLAFKSRGVGASEIAASNCAHAYTFIKESYNIVTAFLEKYVRGTLRKTWQELDFLNLHTEGAFKRVRLKTDTDLKKVASQVDKHKNEFGWKSTIEGITADTPDKLRGDRVDNLYFEESGNNRNLIETYSRAHALVDILGSRVGNRYIFGTSGEQGPQLAGLKTMFYNPEGYTILPYYNRDVQGEPQYTGYFIPSYSMWLGNPPGSGFDSRGVVYLERAKEYYLDKWSKITDPKALIIDKAEYCFTPEDAFVLEGSNNFDQEKLVDQKAALEIHKTIPKPNYMKLHWQLTDGLPDINKMPNFEQCPLSSILFTELPMRDDNGLPFKNLYVIGIDGIDADLATSTGQTDVSKFCIVVMRRQVGLKPSKIVALYKERPKHIKDAWETALKLAIFYNAKVLVEATRTSVIQYFILHKKDYYLMHRPHATANSSGKTNYRQYGVPAPEHVILHYIDLMEAYVSDYCELILFIEAIDELIAYSYENKRKFDIIAAFGMALLADEELLGRVVKPNSGSIKKLSFGYSRNEHGQIQFGTLKTQNFNTYDWIGTTSKRYY